MSNPVVVLYTLATCGHCTTLKKIWPSVEVELRKIYPKIRIVVINSLGQNNPIDRKKDPEGMVALGKWFPIIFLVPGVVWDRAMMAVGTKNQPDIRDGVVILGGSWEKNSSGKEVPAQSHSKHKFDTPANIGIWLKDALENSDFKRVQYSRPLTPKPIVSFEKGENSVIARQDNTKYFNSPVSSSTCTMKFISRGQ